MLQRVLLFDKKKKKINNKKTNGIITFTPVGGGKWKKNG
jgi:hypothetical protein